MPTAYRSMKKNLPNSRRDTTQLAKTVVDMATMDEAELAALRASLAKKEQGPKDAYQLPSKGSKGSRGK